MALTVTRFRMAEGGKAFPGSLGNSAKCALLTISKKEKKKEWLLRMVKRDLAPFLGGSKSPYATFSIKKALNNWRLLLGQQEGRGDSMAKPENGKQGNQLDAGALCVVSVNKHVSVVGGAQGSLAPDSQFPQVGLCEAAQFLQGIVLRHGEPANVGSQQAQRDSLRVWR